MAETRATGKAMRVALSWVMALAGYEATPAEEMPAEPFQTKNPARRYVRAAEQVPAQNNNGTPVPKNTPQEEPDGNGGPSRDDQVAADVAEAFPEAEYVAPPKPTKKSPVKLVANCTQCGEGISDAVLRFSQKQHGQPMCFGCQKKFAVA